MREHKSEHGPWTIAEQIHPVHELRGLKSDRLMGKKILLGVTGSIAAVETVKLTHELIRHGAMVFPVLTKAAGGIINPEALFAAAGIRPITELTGALEHVALCGQVKNSVDLVLIAPCTANTISKVACGIDDSTVTTFATTAIGSGIPIVIVPAMHGSMYEHPIVQENIKKLEDERLNIEFIRPRKTENKWKLPSNDEIATHVIRRLWKRDLNRKRVLIIAGATAEPLDAMRVLTNRGTGYTGIALARLAFMRGGDVTLWLGSLVRPDELRLPFQINMDHFDTVESLQKKVEGLKDPKKSSSGKKDRRSEKNALGFDIIIVSAAISDYTLEKPHSGKLPSGSKNLKLELVPTQKIIKLIHNQAPRSYIVGFKAESNVTEKKLLAKAFQRLKELKLNMIVANDLAVVTKNTNRILIIHPDKKHIGAEGTKELLAEKIFDEVLKDF